MTKAPIAVFVYNRSKHTERLFQSLVRNEEILTSPIYVFSDGPRASSESKNVKQVREIVHRLAPKHATFVEQENNIGLANSIINGISLVTKKHDRVIVLEDDLFLSPTAINYFNVALQRYQDEERVMHISGYMYPVKSELPKTFFYREATCWSWATWKRAWGKFEPDGKKIKRYLVERNLEYEFNVQNSAPFMKLLNRQIKGNIDSWAIRWYGSLWMHSGLALHPNKSLVANLGFDGTGANCSITNAFHVDVFDEEVKEFPDRIEECAQALTAMIAYRKKTNTLPRRAARRLLTIIRRFVGT
jgi:hypothetical protein